MAIILPANTLSTGAYSVANSCRFNSGDSPKMAITPSSGSLTTGTFSTWVKRSKLGAEQNIVSWDGSGSQQGNILFQAGDNLLVQSYNGSGWDLLFTTDAKYRDPSAWMHICVAFDTTQGTEGNRFKLYVNGTQVTLFDDETYPSEDGELQINSKDSSVLTIGAYNDTNYLGGYLAETVWIDGTAYAASDFGEFDEDSPTIWKPKDVSGLTFGTNGFYCDYEASDNLGNDANGGTDLTETNLAAVDQAIDSPTNNFCTFNPHYFRVGRTATAFSQGNCKAIFSDSGGTTPAWGTIMLNHGKWYWEVKVLIVNYSYYGTWQTQGAWTNPGLYDGLSGVNTYRLADGSTNDENVGIASYGDSGSNNDIVGCAFDCDTGTIWFSKNGVWQKSATQAEVVAGTTTNAAFTGKAYSTNGVLPIVTAYYGASVEVNFGGCSAFAITSGNADDNDYGNFEYDVPTGYYSICTKNLAEFGG
jgi:hypothetical protein